MQTSVDLFITKTLLQKHYYKTLWTKTLWGKPKARLRLYVGGNVKARLDVALPRFHALARLGLKLARDRTEPSLASALPPT